MSTRVVNLRKEPFEAYVGRPGKGQDGYYGNPIRMNDVCFLCQEIHTDGGSTIPCFRVYFMYRLENDVEFRDRVLALKDKTLGCFCKPKPCHGDVIAEWLDVV